ncbi:MAG: pyridoxamine 5'-phosphate oxidase family protein [Chloroflexota bacterium]|nr:pyridoxamine 5'-phosphate oxidase family protein [Chloroflexota bacterium]
MTQTVSRQRLTSIAELRDLVGSPTERAVRKQLAALDAHCRAFVERSPFMLLGTSGVDGRCDVSPKGDRPGFVLVDDDTTLMIPDRPGNRRFDSLQNILQNPHVGLLFLIPGMDETLRVNGTATLVRDEDVLQRLAVDGKLPVLAILVHVEEAFLHCGRSSLRAQVWDPSHWTSREEMPSLSRIIADQTRPADRPQAEHERLIKEQEVRTAESYRCLY